MYHKRLHREEILESETENEYNVLVLKLEVTTTCVTRDWDEEYYSQEEFEAHYGENGQMCYEAAKHATTETISALLQMQRDQRTFSSLKAEVRHGVLVDAKARKKNYGS